MKTIEEAAKEYSQKCYPYMVDMRMQSESHFDAGVEFAQRWIPVSKEYPIPNDTEFLLIKFDNGEIRRYEEEWPFAEATHWRPIEYK